MEEELITYSTAKLAKEKGFLLHTIDVFYQYDGTKSLCHRNSKRALQVQDMDRPECYAPTQTLLQKWLREEHNLHININDGNIEGFYTSVCKLHKNEWLFVKDIMFKTYEQALEKGLQEALKLIKNK